MQSQKYLLFLFSTILFQTSSAEDVLFVGTGYDDLLGSLADIELVGCGAKPPDYPLYIRGAFGDLVDGKVTICGGGYFLLYSKDCYQLDPATNTWNFLTSMAEIRSGSTALSVPDVGLWVAGGYDGGPIKDTTEIYKDGIWTAGPKLPITMWDHCSLQLNSTHSMVIGGYSNGELTAVKGAWIYDWNSEVWTTLAEMEIGRDDHYCGILEDGRILVAGGIGLENAFLDSVEIYDPKSDQWTAGPTLPNNRWGGKAVRVIEDESTGKSALWLVTGRIGQSFTPEILRFEEDTESWSRVEDVIIQTPRHYSVVLTTPREAVNQC